MALTTIEAPRVDAKAVPGSNTVLAIVHDMETKEKYGVLLTPESAREWGHRLVEAGNGLKTATDMPNGGQG